MYEKKTKNKYYQVTFVFVFRPKMNVRFGFVFGRKWSFIFVGIFVYGQKMKNSFRSASSVHHEKVLVLRCKGKTKTSVQDQDQKRKRKSPDFVFSFLFHIHSVTKSALQCAANTSSNFGFLQVVLVDGISHLSCRPTVYRYLCDVLVLVFLVLKLRSWS